MLTYTWVQKFVHPKTKWRTSCFCKLKLSFYSFITNNKNIQWWNKTFKWRHNKALIFSLFCDFLFLGPFLSFIKSLNIKNKTNEKGIQIKQSKIMVFLFFKNNFFSKMFSFFMPSFSFISFELPPTFVLHTFPFTFFFFLPL